MTLVWTENWINCYSIWLILVAQISMLFLLTILLSSSFASSARSLSLLSTTKIKPWKNTKYHQCGYQVITQVLCMVAYCYSQYSNTDTCTSTDETIGIFSIPILLVHSWSYIAFWFLCLTTKVSKCSAIIHLASLKLPSSRSLTSWKDTWKYI